MRNDTPGPIAQTEGADSLTRREAKHSSRLREVAVLTSPDPDPEQIIDACVKNKGGSMRMVADPAECTARETAFSWVGQ